MTLGDLKTYALARCAGLNNSIAQVAGTSGDTLLKIMIQKAADNVALRTIALKVNETFDVVADQADYDLSEVVERYCTMDTPGLWWYTGVEWKQVKARTIEWLDENRRNWRNESSGDPEYFFVHGNTLTTVPAPATAVTNGFKLYFGRHAFDMTTDAHVPFYGETIADEISQFSDLDEAIICHVRWKALGILGKNDEYSAAEKEYDREIEKMIGLLARNKAVQGDRTNKMQGPRIR
jgi:hypothetical protein